jgi:hypothetical protein
MPPASALPVFFGEGLMAVGGKDWIIYAYRCEKGAASPAGAGWEEQQAELRESEQGPRQVAEQGPETAPAGAGGAIGVTAAQLMREALLGSGDRELIEELLEKAERVLESREPRPGELEYLRAAEAVLTEGVLNPKFRGGRLINDFPELRGRAAELLGRQGDLGSRRPLFELMQYEWAAGGVGKSVEALGRLGGVGSGEGIAFLLGRLQAGGSAIGDGLAAKMIDYVGREFRYHGIVRRDAVELLQAIYLGEFGRAVRLKAVETLRGLKRDA